MIAVIILCTTTAHLYQRVRKKEKVSQTTDLVGDGEQYYILMLAANVWRLLGLGMSTTCPILIKFLPGFPFLQTSRRDHLSSRCMSL